MVSSDKLSQHVQISTKTSYRLISRGLEATRLVVRITLTFLCAYHLLESSEILNTKFVALRLCKNLLYDSYGILNGRLALAFNTTD